jgi:hypothetical protein
MKRCAASISMDRASKIIINNHVFMVMKRQDMAGKAPKWCRAGVRCTMTVL